MPPAKLLEATRFPAVVVMSPGAVIVVPAAMVVPDTRAVVVVRDPGAVIEEGRDQVKVLVPPVVVIWLAVPDIVTAPKEVGTTGLVPASGTKESMATPPPERAMVTVLPVADVVTPAPPAMVIAPEDGRAEPVSPLSWLSAPVPALS